MFEQWNNTVAAVQQFLTQHMPQGVTDKAGLGALGALVGGVFLCVLGAKLARVGMTLGWAAAGGAVGYKVAQVAGMPPVVGVLLFAAGIGAIGYLTYRIWVGLLTAGVITALVLGAFGYQRVAPRIAEYNARTPGISLAATDGGTASVSMNETGSGSDAGDSSGAEGAGSEAGSAGGFTVPTALAQAAYRQGQLRRELGDFWGFVKTQDLTVAAHAKALLATALVFGLLIGLSTIRLTLILSTSLVGTLLVSSGVIGAINVLFPGFAVGAAQRPLINAAAMAVCLLISVILQVRLTRVAKEEAAEAPKAKKA
ncbi:MAG: hypothetical protein IT449_16270 [Phycisphaerales bacterium]|nr:hypothetical protein [Phycisphaerales bacterium]